MIIDNRKVMIMKRYLCFVLACLLSFVLIGCSNSTDVNEITTSYEETGTGVELTNPGEYLADLCSSVKIDDVEFSLPCTLEEMTNLFSLTLLKEGSPNGEGFTTKSYGIFTSEGMYFGIVTFAFYSDNSESWIIFNDYRKKDISDFGDDIKREHSDDETTFIIGDFISGKTKRSEITSKLGAGYVSETLINEGQLYDFEDGRLVILYDDNDTVIEFHVCFGINN